VSLAFKILKETNKMASKNSKKTIKENQGAQNGSAKSKVWGISNPGKVANKYDGWGTKKNKSKE
tara:strand:+ start:409 stop:600 length:192 start_codon:yes stop_codon:yes gene_type:complete